MLLVPELEVAMTANFDAVYEFLRKHYLHSRFEGSPNLHDFPDYPVTVTLSTLEQIEQTGQGFISRFESNTGREVIFDDKLTILNPDTPPGG
jgi:hypothetical protein